MQKPILSLFRAINLLIELDKKWSENSDRFPLTSGRHLFGIAFSIPKSDAQKPLAKSRAINSFCRAPVELSTLSPVNRQFFAESDFAPFQSHHPIDITGSKMVGKFRPFFLDFRLALP